MLTTAQLYILYRLNRGEEILEDCSTGQARWTLDSEVVSSAALRALISTAMVMRYSQRLTAHRTEHRVKITYQGVAEVKSRRRR